MRADPSDPVPAGHPQATRLRFGGFVLDLARGCLLLNEDEIALRPKTFAVMRYLAASPRRLVPKDELFAAVWPGLTVTDDALVQSIGELRRALGKEGAHLIKTVPRRGYRFEAGVSIEGSTDQRSATGSGAGWRSGSAAGSSFQPAQAGSVVRAAPRRLAGRRPIRLACLRHPAGRRSGVGRHHCRAAIPERASLRPRVRTRECRQTCDCRSPAYKSKREFCRRVFCRSSNFRTSLTHSASFRC